MLHSSPDGGERPVDVIVEPSFEHLSNCPSTLGFGTSVGLAQAPVLLRENVRRMHDGAALRRGRVSRHDAGNCGFVRARRT
jgi:hypothetical protein